MDPMFESEIAYRRDRIRAGLPRRVSPRRTLRRRSRPMTPAERTPR